MMESPYPKSERFTDDPEFTTGARPASWGEVEGALEDGATLNFNPDQPRDERGRFTSGGGGGASGTVLPYGADRNMYWLGSGEQREYNALTSTRTRLGKKVKAGTATQEERKTHEGAVKRLAELSSTARDRREEAKAKGIDTPEGPAGTGAELLKGAGTTTTAVDTGRTKAGLGRGPSLAEVQERLKVAGDAAARVEEMESIVAEHLQPPMSTRAHGMTNSEQHSAVFIDGKEFSFPVSWSRGKVAGALRELVREDFPKKLWDSTSRYIFSDQRNADDAKWEREYGIPGFKSAATGGDGTVVSYNGQMLTRGSAAHEMGHNFARTFWSTLSPSPFSAYGVAQTEEPPVSDYARQSNKDSEDFAEACRMYSGRQAPLVHVPGDRGSSLSLHDQLRLYFPRKYAALKDLLGE